MRDEMKERLMTGARKKRLELWFVAEIIEQGATQRL